MIIRKTAVILAAVLMLFCALSVPAAALSVPAAALSGDTETVSVFTPREYVELEVQLEGRDQTATALYDAYYDLIYLNLAPLAELAGYCPQEILAQDTGNFSAFCEGFNLLALKNEEYAQCNNRYLYLPGGYVVMDGTAYFPIESVCRAFGLELIQNPVTGRISVAKGEEGVICGGKKYYHETFGKDNVNWLSKIIQAEAEGENMAAKIAVGNVILNRVEDPYFPKTIHDVIFDVDVDGTVQFSPTQTGGINLPPSEASVAAACLCLEGVNTGGAAEFFVEQKYAKNSWFEKSLTYVTTEGNLVFYADPRRVS